MQLPTAVNNNGGSQNQRTTFSSTSPNQKKLILQIDRARKTDHICKKKFGKSTQESTFFSIFTIFHLKTLCIFLTPVNILFLPDFFLNESVD